MEEADLLSDRCVVMVDGQLRCIGTSLKLKNEFGDGYHISLTTTNGEEVKALVSALLPEAHLLDESGSSLVFSTGNERESCDGIIRFVKLMEGTADEKVPRE
jgi:ABC-type multidrug transport system ATPase subunit